MSGERPGRRPCGTAAHPDEQSFHEEPRGRCGPRDPRPSGHEGQEADKGHQFGWHERRHAGILPRVTTPELTEELSTEAMARAEKVACPPANHRCSALPDPVQEARTTCTSKGRCKIGWILANSGRDSWDVWLDVQAGEGRLRRRTD